MKFVKSVLVAGCSAALAMSLVPVTAIAAFADTGSTDANTPAAGNTAASGSDTGTTDTPTPEVAGTTTTASIKYKVRSTKGYGAAAKDGATAKTQGGAVTGVRICRINVKTTTTYTDPTLEPTTTTKSYKVTGSLSVVSKGWKKLKKSSAYSQYNAGSSLVQALNLALPSTISSSYDLYYRSYDKTFGWHSWAKNGAKAGTTGQKVGITKLQVKLVEKGGAAPSGNSTFSAYIKAPTVSYALDLAGSGYTSTKTNGAAAGKTSYKAKSQRLKATVTSPEGITGGIEYAVRTGKSSWSEWTSNGADAGVDGKTAQAIKVRLTGDLATYYNVYYASYCGDHHWLGWAKNGAASGTGKINYPLGAVKIKLVAKSAAAPTPTSGAYKTKLPKGAGEIVMLRKAQKYSSSTNYLILVDRSDCQVAVFKGSKNNWSLVRYFSCVVGAPSTPTILGSYTLGYHLDSLPAWPNAKYCTNIYGGYFFHSVLSSTSELGSWASHGCIRVSWSNARWIQTLPTGTKVVIYA